MVKILAIILALMLPAWAGTGEENMDYRIIGGRGRVYGADVSLVSAETGEVICEIPVGEHLVLMGEKSDGSYTLVNYGGKAGFVPGENVDMQLGIGGMGLNKVLTDQDWYNISSFMTVYTRDRITDAGEGYFRAEEGEEIVLDEAVSGPFAIVDHVSDMEDGTYRVRFNTFGYGEEWTDDDISMKTRDAKEKYPEMGYGWAEFAAEDLADPATYSLIEMIMVD